MSGVIIFFSSSIMVSLLTLFLMSGVGMKIKRVVKNLPLSIVENSIEYEIEEAPFDCYYHKDKLEVGIKNYLNLNLKNTLDSYKISFFYFKINDKNEIKIDMSEYPKAFQVHFVAKYYHSFKVDSFTTFSIGTVYE